MPLMPLFIILSPGYQLSRDKDKLASNSNIPRKCAPSAATQGQPGPRSIISRSADCSCCRIHWGHSSTSQCVYALASTAQQVASLRAPWRHAAYVIGLVLCTGQWSEQTPRQSDSVGHWWAVGHWRPVSVLLWSVTVGPIIYSQFNDVVELLWTTHGPHCLSVCQCCQAGCRSVIATNIQNI